MRRTDSVPQLSSAQARAADEGHKGLMPVGESARPFLDYILSALADAGCRSVCIVVGPGHQDVRRYYEDERPPSRLHVEFAQQQAPHGTAHALLTTEAFAGDDPFLTLNSDNLYPVSVLRQLVALNGPGLVAFERDTLIADSGFPFERVAAFALLDVDAGSRLRGIFEKPGLDRMTAAGPHALVSMNVWRFDHRIFDACRAVRRSPRGEFELPEAVGVALTNGVEFLAVRGRGPILDLSSRADVTHVSAHLAGQQPTP